MTNRITILLNDFFRRTRALRGRAEGPLSKKHPSGMRDAPPAVQAQPRKPAFHATLTASDLATYCAASGVTSRS